jgi:hypothetical protein
VSNFVIFFNEVEFGDHACKICELIFPHLKKLFNNVLDPLLNFTFMQNGPKSLKNSVCARWSHFLQDLAT